MALTDEKKKTKSLGKEIIEASGWIIGGYLLATGVHEFVVQVRSYYPLYGIIKIAMAFLLIPLLRRSLRELFGITLSPLKTSISIFVLLVAIVSIPVGLTDKAQAIVTAKQAQEAKYSEYTSKEMAEEIYKEYDSALDDELIPPCGPAYESSCLMEIALNHLVKYGLENQQAFSAFRDLSFDIFKSGNIQLADRALDIIRSKKEWFFPTLMELAYATIESGNPQLINKILNILLEEKSLEPKEDRKRKIEIMRLYFASGDFDKGIEVLEELRAYAEPVSYHDTPQIAAIYFFLRKENLARAKELVFMTKDEPFEITNSGHIKYQKSNIVYDLMRAYTEEGKPDEAMSLLPVASEKSSAYYNPGVYGDMLGVIASHYATKPDSEKISKLWCEKFLNDVEKKDGNKYAYMDDEEFKSGIGYANGMKFHHYWLLLINFENMGCRDEQLIIAKEMNEKFIDTLISEDDRVVKFKIWSVLGESEILMKEGKNLIKKGRSIRDSRERFDYYRSLVYKFNYVGLDDLRSQAAALVEKTYNEADKEYWLTNLLMTLRVAEETDKITSYLDQSIINVKKRGSPRELEVLAELLRIFNHPSYPAFERYDFLTDREKLNLEKVKTLIKENKVEDARIIFNSWKDSIEFPHQLLPFLFDRGSKDIFFQEVWAAYMRNCFIDKITRINSRQPEVFVPLCMSATVSHALQ